MGPSACVPHTQFGISPAPYNASWPHRETHRNPTRTVRMRLGSPHPPNTPSRGPIVSPTEIPSGTAR
eukprot:4670488-Pyramimonas_sp.AAC.1